MWPPCATATVSATRRSMIVNPHGRWTKPLMRLRPATGCAQPISSPCARVFETKRSAVSHLRRPTDHAAALPGQRPTRQAGEHEHERGWFRHDGLFELLSEQGVRGRCRMHDVPEQGLVGFAQTVKVFGLKQGSVTLFRPYAPGLATMDRRSDAVSANITPAGRLARNAALNASVIAEPCAENAGPPERNAGVRPRSGIPGTRICCAPSA